MAPWALMMFLEGQHLGFDKNNSRKPGVHM